jgi:hypothetical protein
MSLDYQRSACELGDDAVYVPVEGLGHRQIIDPVGPAWPVIAGHLGRLLAT